MSLDFVAANQEHVDLGTSSLFDPGAGELTIMSWIKTAIAGSGKANIVVYGANFGGGKRYRIHFDNDAGSVAVHIDDNVTKVGIISTAALNDDNWHHVAAVRDNAANLLRLFIDGLPDGTVSIAGIGSLDSTRGAKIGAIIDESTGLLNEWMEGDIEDVRYYIGRALDAKEIAAIFVGRGHDGIVNGLTARYPLNEGAIGVAASVAGSIKDISRNGLDGTPVNTPIYATSNLAFRRRVA